MAAHLYWRVTEATVSGGNAGSCVALDFRAVAGGPNVAVGGTPIASSVYVAGYEANKAFDGNAATFWSSASALPAWLGYQFAAPVSIVECAWTSRSDQADQNPTNPIIEWSDDGVTWTRDWMNDIGGWSVGQTKVFTRPADSAIGRAYWRLWFEAQNIYIPALAKLDFRATPFGADQAQGSGGTAIASSIFASGYEADKAFDGNAATLWSSASNVPCWLGYHFTGPIKCEQVVTQARSDAADGPRSFMVQSSDDNVNWNIEWSVVNSVGWNASEVRPFSRASVNYSPSTLPVVAGTKQLDVDPAQFPSGTRADGVLLYNGNTTPVMTQMTGYPSWREQVFPTGRPAMRTVKAVSGFAYPRSVQDDFSLYLVVKLAAAASNASGAQWYQCGALFDSEQGGAGNDYGLNLAVAGNLVWGTGNPDTSTAGTKNVADGVPHVITVVRIKATGVTKVYVDDVLDITHNGSGASLTYCAYHYFGSSQAVGQVSADYGRMVTFDAAHSDTDRLAITASLKSQYIQGATALRVAVKLPLRSSLVFAKKVNAWEQTDFGPDILDVPGAFTDIFLGVGPGVAQGLVAGTQYHNISAVYGGITARWDDYTLSPGYGGAPVNGSWQGTPGTGLASTTPHSIFFDKPFRQFMCTLMQVDYNGNKIEAYDGNGTLLGTMTFTPVLVSQADMIRTLDLGVGAQIRQLKFIPDPADWVTWKDLHIFTESPSTVGGWRKTDLDPDNVWAGTDPAPATVWTNG